MARKRRTGNSRAEATRREQLRAQQLAEAARQRSRRRVLLGLSGIPALGLLGGGGYLGWDAYRDRQATNARIAAAQITPPNATADGTAIGWNPSGAGEQVPLLTLFEDFQCPFCKQLEDTHGAVLTELATAGAIRLQYRTLTFLDGALSNDSSRRAARAAAAADLVGQFKPYHDVVFAHQPAKEGEGYTDQQLRVEFAAEAGITGANLTTFQKAYDDQATLTWVDSAEQKSQTTWLGSTPQIDLNGTNPKAVDANGQPVTDGQGQPAQWWTTLEATTASWQQAITTYTS